MIKSTADFVDFNPGTSKSLSNFLRQLRISFVRVLDLVITLWKAREVVYKVCVSCTFYCYLIEALLPVSGEDNDSSWFDLCRNLLPYGG